MVELKKKYKGIIDEEMIDSFDQKSKNLLSQAMRISARNSITESKTIDNTIDYEKLYNKEYFYYNNTFLANPEIFEEILLMSSVKIIDLGLSSKVDINGCAFTVCYNPVTVAPEMIDILCNNNNSGKSSEGIYDNRIDLWSLGCIIYFMAVGKYPFTLLKDNKKDLQNDFEIGRYYIKKTSNNISYELIDLISRLLQKKKELRINSQSVLMHAFIVNPIELQHMVNLDDIKSEYLSEKSTLINLNINECMNVKNIIKESSLTKNLSKNEKLMSIDSKHFLNFLKDDTQSSNNSIYEDPHHSVESILIVKKVESEYVKIKKEFVDEFEVEELEDEFGFNHINKIEKK